MSDLETAQPCFVCGGTGRDITTEEWERLSGQGEGNDDRKGE